ncbi:Gfo/Idh/MocA family oxidoreductase [uncultured Propionivibrio sp.]|uniref:Gfo/Idh/MocA family protein n=1 Tax=uncultured Propionivibrio sp. TaxID=426737 RepID=UPI0029BFEED5|nr:Gfo/Idh/MocA family oxidoreductase [uncultured Propionivibrio sp.]
MKYVMIGTGNIANTYLAAIGKLPDSQVVACVSRSGRRPTSAPDLPCAASLAEISVPFDAVIIGTPNGLHHQAAIEAARLGKHVLTEKPLDIHRATMDAMIDACRRAGVTLAVAYQRRTNPDNITLKRLFAQGAFGRVFAADLSCKFWRDQAYFDSGAYRGSWEGDGGGAFMQQACHNIDTYLWFFGMPAEVTSHVATFVHPIEVEDHGAALLKYENGMIGTIIASTAARPGLPARLEVHCEKGSFVTLDDRISYWAIDGIDNPASAAVPANGNNANSATITDTARHEDILRDFEAAVRDKRPPLIDAESARQTTELILRIYGRQ